MSRSLFTVIVLTAAAAMPLSHAQGFGQQPSAVFYEDAQFGGRTIAASGAMSGFGQNSFMNDRASSVKITGTWKVCEHGNFKGHCEILTGDVADLRTIRMNNNISSAMPVTGFGSGGSGGSSGGNGVPPDSGFGGNSGVVLFSNPRHHNRYIAYCGKSPSTCGKPVADAFCRMKGFPSSDRSVLDIWPRTALYNPLESSLIGSGKAFRLIACNKVNDTGGPGFGSGGGNGGSQGGNGKPPGFGSGGGQGGNGESPGFGSGGGQGGNDSAPGFGSGGNGGSQGGNGQVPGFGSSTSTFNDPTLNGKYIAYCGKSPSSCGKPVADAFCKAKARSGAVAFHLDTRMRGPLINPLEMSVSQSGQAFKSIACK